MSFNPEEQYYKAMQAYQAGNITEAVVLMDGVIQAVPNHDGLLTTYGGLLLANKDIEKASEILDRAIQLNPNNLDAWSNKSLVYRSLGELGKAMDVLDNIIAKEPTKTNGYLNKATIYFENGQYEQAEAILKKIAAIQPNDLNVINSLGKLYMHQHQHQAALQVFTSALAIQSDFVPALISIGMIYTEIGKLGKAANSYQKVIGVQPNHPQPYMLLGKVYVELGQLTDAEAFLQKAIQLNPQFVLAYILLGNIAKERKNTNQAQTFYEKALSIEPSNEVANSNLRKLLNRSIPQWHFFMLADEDRNAIYQKAIEKAVTSDSIVLDIGTGTGLLSMMAARAGANKVVACEMHPQLATIAKEIVKDNGYKDKITVHSKKSTALTLGKELEEKANLLVSEILDSGGLGEGVIPSVRHAIQHHLTETATIIPAKIKWYCQLIEIPLRSRVSPVNEIAGFDLSAFDKFRAPNEYIQIHLQTEKYTTLSEVVPFLEIDFYNLPPAITESNPQSRPVMLPIVKDGIGQAMVFWFDIYLDNEEEIIASTRLGGTLVHWGQALYCFPNPQQVKAGTSLGLTAWRTDTVIWFSY